MDIRLGKQNRLRLSEADLLLLKSEGVVREFFQVAQGLDLSFEVCLQSRPGQGFESVDKKLIFRMTPRDLDWLSQSKGAGLSVGNYVVEIDLWSQKTRDRHQENQTLRES